MPRCSHTCGSPALMPPCLDTRQQTKCCPQGAKEDASVGAGSSRAQAIAHLTICYQTPCSSQVSQPYRCHSSTMRSIPRGEIRNHSARSIFPLHVPGSDASLKCDGMGEAAKMRANFRRSDAEGCGRQSGSLFGDEISDTGRASDRDKLSRPRLRPERHSCHDLRTSTTGVASRFAGLQAERLSTKSAPGFDARIEKANPRYLPAMSRCGPVRSAIMESDKLTSFETIQRTA